MDQTYRTTKSEVRSYSLRQGKDEPRFKTTRELDILELLEPGETSSFESSSEEPNAQLIWVEDRNGKYLGRYCSEFASKVFNGEAFVYGSGDGLTPYNFGHPCQATWVPLDQVRLSDETEESVYSFHIHRTRISPYREELRAQPVSLRSQSHRMRLTTPIQEESQEGGSLAWIGAFGVLALMGGLVGSRRSGKTQALKKPCLLLESQDSEGFEGPEEKKEPRLEK